MSDQKNYDIFISYSRKDNAPIPATYPHGWVTAIRDHILADHRRFSTAPLRIFFDGDEIKDMDDWRHRILGALRSSKILLVCLSPNYFASPYCEMEWKEYVKRQVHQLMGSESIASVYFVEIPGSGESDNARRLESLLRGNFTDIRPWFPEGAETLQQAEVQTRMAALGASLWERIERARRAEAAPGNLRWQNPHFVGRTEELRRLHEQLAVGAIGVVTAVHGLGGQGKTELAVAYAHGWADSYPAGLWLLRAEGKSELLPLIGELAFEPQFNCDPAFPFTPTDAEKNNPALLGSAVLTHLKLRSDTVREGAPDRSAAAILLLDNVSDAALLSLPQIATLPAHADWLRILATTRLGPENLSPKEKTLALMPVDALNQKDALALLRDHQPLRDRARAIVADPALGAPAFASTTEEDAARNIARELGGFTLAIEQAAVFLGLHPDIAPSTFLAGLQSKGVPAVDDLPSRDAGVALQMQHQEKQLGPILEATLERLDILSFRALCFASLFPPDIVPWPWLKALAEGTTTDSSSTSTPDLWAPDPWTEACRRLTGLRLLTPGDSPEVTRIHRLIAAHLQKKTEAPTAEALGRWLETCANSIARSQSSPRDWELNALLAALPHHLSQFPSRGLASSALDLSETVKTYRSLAAASHLLASGVTIIETLAASDPGNAAWQRDLSVSFNKLGDLAVAQGDLVTATSRFSQDLAISERLAASDPSNAAWQRDLSVSFNKLGDLAVARGDLVVATSRFSQALGIRERLAASDPANADWQRDLSISFERLGDLAVAQGDLVTATSRFSRALAIGERLAASDPGNAAWQRDLSISHERLGELAVAQGDLVTASSRFSQALAIRERLANSDPGNAAWQRNLSVSFNRLGNLAVAQGDLVTASSRFSQALAIRERLANNDPANADWQRDISVSFSNLGDLAAAQGDLVTASSRFSSALAIAERLANSDPANADWQRELSASFYKLGELAVAQGDLVTAASRFSQDLAISERLANSDPGNAAWQRDLSISFNKLGDLAVAQGDLVAAASRFSGALAIAERLANSDPANADWQRDLSISFGKLGSLAVAQGNLITARARFSQSLAIAERLANSDPGNAEWQRDLWVSYLRMGDSCQKRSQSAESREWRRKAYDTLVKMKKAGLHISPGDEHFLSHLRTVLEGN